MMLRNIIFITFCVGFSIGIVQSWDGYDSETSTQIEIEKGNLVRPGREIEVYHWDTGEYLDEEVISVSSSEVETYNSETDEYHVYDMD